MNWKSHLFTFLVILFLIGFIFSSMTLAFVNLPAEYHYTIIHYEGGAPKNLTLIIPIPYVNGKPVIKVKSSPGLNVSVIETQYGKMLKVEAENAEWITVASYISNEETIDVMSSNITLLPAFEKEYISKSESDKELSIVYKIKVPVYAEFEGNSTVLIEYDVHSGFKALPFFFIFTIPWEPRYELKPYVGQKTIRFMINSTGWHSTGATEKLRIIYQRMW